MKTAIHTLIALPWAWGMFWFLEGHLLHNWESIDVLGGGFYLTALEALFQIIYLVESNKYR